MSSKLETKNSNNAKLEKAEKYEDKCSKLEINLNFNNRNETVYIDNKKTIKAIKESVYNCFYPIQGKIQLIYKNKDISPFEDIALNKYFKSIMKISVKIKLSENSNENKKDGSKNLSTSFLSSLHDITVIDKNEISVGNINQSQFSSGVNPLIDKNRMMCNNCKEQMICYFCRDCNIFICKECAEKYSSIHHNHSIIDVNPYYIEKSAKAYRDLLNKEVYNTSQKFDLFSGTDKKFSQIEEIDGWLNEIGGKIDLLAEIMQENKEETKKGIINFYEKENEYNNILNNLQGLNFGNSNDTGAMFTEMYNIEQNINEMNITIENNLKDTSKDQGNDKIMNELSSQLDKIINKLAKGLDTTGKTSEKVII